MATSNGPWQNHARIEWDYSVSGESSGKRTVSVTAYLRMENLWSINGTWPKSWSGAWGSGSSSQYMNLSGGQRVAVVTGSPSVTLTDSAQTVTFSASVSHAHGSTGSTLTVSVPARVPLAPYSLVATRNSDTQYTLNWSRPSTYTAVVVQRATNAGAWQQIARPTGNAFSYVDKTTKAGNRYQYRVAGVSAGGQSGWSNTVTVFTTPNAPSGVSAVRDGANIVVSASGVPAYVDSYTVLDNGVQVASGVSLPWTHVAPDPGVPHTYTLRAVKSGLTGPVSAASNTVQLLSKPLPPTGLTPNGAVVASDVATVFSWVHTPVDSSPQSAAELRYRLSGGAWTTLTTSTASTLSLTLDEGSYEWQVRTKGAHVDWSDWSAVAVVTSVTRPGVAVVKPGPILTVRAVRVEWSWLQAQGRPQSSYEIELLQAGQLVERRTGTGATSAVTLAHKASHDTEYTVRVRAATGNIWSGWAEQTFTVDIPPAAPAIVDGGWDEETGTVTLSASEGDRGEPPLPATVGISIERSIDDGDTWEPVLDTTDLPLSVVDSESLSNGTTLYRVVSRTADEGSSEVIHEVISDSDAIWVNGGDGFTEAARLPYDPDVQVEAGRDRALKQYSGRALPVAYSGEAVTRTVSFGGSILLNDTENSGLETLERVAQAAAPLHQYRDPDGRRVRGVLSPLNTARQSHVHWSYSASLTESDS